MDKDLKTLMEEFKSIIDAYAQEILRFRDSDLEKLVLRRDEWGPYEITLRSWIWEWLDELLVHRGQVAGARYNVSYRQATGEFLEAEPNLELAERLKKLKPIRLQNYMGYGRNDISRLAGEAYLRGHAFLSEFIGVDESLMDEMPRPGEWSGKEALEHLVKMYDRARIKRTFDLFEK